LSGAEAQELLKKGELKSLKVEEEAASLAAGVPRSASSRRGGLK